MTESEAAQARVMSKVGTKEWIGVDLDGTLAYYDAWDPTGGIGAPITRMVDRVKDWLAKGLQVRIVTARVSLPEQAEEQRERIESWCKVVFGHPLPVTHMKDLLMIELWDDRCVQVERNTGRAIGRE